MCPTATGYSLRAENLIFDIFEAAVSGWQTVSVDAVVGHKSEHQKKCRASTIITGNNRMKRVFQWATLITLSCLGAKAEAQVFYYDISPDQVINTWSALTISVNAPQPATGHSTDLEIWNDGGSDINVRAGSPDCEVLINGLYPAALSVNQPIGAAGTWAQPTGTDHNELNNGSVGNWKGLTDKYLGVRIKSGTNWLYGWIRMDVNAAGTSVTIKDYACNTVPGAPINAGQATAGINDLPGIPGERVSVYPNPFHSLATIKSATLLDDASLFLYDATGRVVKSVVHVSGDEIKIDRENLAGGIYLYELRRGRSVSTGKVIIAD